MAYTNFVIIGHSMSAAGYAALAVWIIHWMRARNESSAVQIGFIGALFTTAMWSLTSMAIPDGSALTLAFQTLRNAAWLLFMLLLPRQLRGEHGLSAAGYVYTALFTVIVIELMLLFIRPAGMSWTAMKAQPYGELLDMLNMIFAIGALMLVHDIYRSSDKDARWGIALPMGALAALWCYDLNVHTISYLSDDMPGGLVGARGFVAAALVPVFALGTRRNARLQIRLSRRVAFQSASLVTIGLYLFAMVVAAHLIDTFGGQHSRAYALVTLFAMSIGGLLFIPSEQFRSRMRVSLAKHFFSHRYDYRDEWMRFTDTIGRTDNEMGPIGHRVLKAVCDICDSPGALLLMPDNIGHFRVAGRWNWTGSDAKGELLSPLAARSFAQRNFVVDLENARRGIGASAAFPHLPAWALAERRAWIMVPFVHFGRLVGLAVLQRPRVIRPLDWEDLDMLRVASAQAASYLAEEHGRESLLEVQRFEEFNRRFAFIMHDLKNLVSQLSLLARNAERHADNPDFRADMVETLSNSVGKMNELLARLSQHNKGQAEPPRPCDLSEIAKGAVREKANGNVVLIAPAPVIAHADAVRVETILGHLIQNALDASAPHAPVQVRVSERNDKAAISIIDSGKGISEEFLREKLFKPFNSNKKGGFGIGAYEAQMLARAMEGHIDVESQLGVGSRFTLYLPLSQGDDKSAPAQDEEAAA